MRVGIFLNSQERLLKIFLEMIDGKVLTKQDLMAEFNKSDATIQRDIMAIEELLTERAEEHYFHSGDTQKVLLEDYVREHGIQRSAKGHYQINKFLYGLRNESELTEEELLIVLQVLLASRTLVDEEMTVLCDKILRRSRNPKQLHNFIANERLNYRGVPKEGILAKIQFVCDCILHHKEIQFDYTKYGTTKTLRRIPNAIFFADMYIYMLTAKNDAQDDDDLEHLYKFRINNMCNERVISCQNKTKYAERFQGGLLRKQTYWPFLGKEITLTVDFYWDPIYVLDRFPDSKIISEKDGVYRIEMKVNDGYGMKMWLLSQGDMVKVISPSHMRDYVVKDMAQTLAYYGYKVIPQEK